MSRRICIENLYQDIDVTGLCKEFGKYGRILSANIEYDENFSSLCKGYICFFDSSNIDLAIKEMKGKKKLGNPIHIEIEKYKRQESHSNVPEIDDSKIFVNNLDPTWDDCDVIKIFKEFGDIDEVKIYYTDGKSNGYGFVKFLKPTSAKTAIKKMNNAVICKRKLIVEPFIPWSLREETWQSLDFAKQRGVEFNNLHVKNLEKDVTEEELEKIFQSFGSILSVKIARDDAKNSKGYGFVCFLKKEDAAKAREKMDHSTYKSKILEINFNQKKYARQKYFKAIKTDPQMRHFKGGKESI